MKKPSDLVLPRLFERRDAALGAAIDAARAQAKEGANHD